MDNEIEIKIYLEQQGYNEYEIEEIIEDYLPEVKKHLGFRDDRSDKRFVVKFHDVCYFTHTPEDMSDDEFNNLFDMFCGWQYDGIKMFIEDECYLTEQALFSIHDIGNYKAFEYLQEDTITEDNCLDIAVALYEAGVSPFYIDDYTALVNELQNMEDNYMYDWLEFLKGYTDNECVGITDVTIKNIERRWTEYKKTHKL